MKTDLDLIKELDEQDIAASKLQDSSRLLELWDQEGVALPPGGQPIIGIEAISNWLGEEEEPDYEIDEYTHDFQSRKVIGDWAFEWGTFISGAKPINEGLPIRSSGNLLRILKRQLDGGWKVAIAIWNTDET